MKAICYNDVHKKIATLRLKAGYSRREWAKVLGIHYTSACSYESKKKTPAHYVLVKMQEVLAEKGIKFDLSELL